VKKWKSLVKMLEMADMKKSTTYVPAKDQVGIEAFWASSNILRVSLSASSSSQLAVKGKKTQNESQSEALSPE
jgi:hypothetical protein